MVTRAERNIAWIERYCRVPEGGAVGAPVVLRDWQRDILRRIYDNQAGTRRAILSFGRKNGKTALAACLVLLHLCGPEARRNSELCSAAQSRSQAALLFSLAAKMVRLHPDLRAAVTIRDTVKQLACGELGTRYEALAAEASTAYGRSPALIVHDELGQVRGPVSPLYEALETATGAQQNPLSIVISTQAATDDDLLSLLIDDALAGHDPRTVAVIYTAPSDMDPFSEAAIRAANPAFGDFQNAEETLAMAAAAARLPSRESYYRNLVLNQRVEGGEEFIPRAAWTQCGGEPVEFGRNVEVFGGLDLSAVADLTAFVAVARVGAVWHVRPTFWIPGAGLRERSEADRVPFDVWARTGAIQTTPGHTVEYEFVAAWLAEFCATHTVRRIAFDRWNWRHLRPWLARAGFHDDLLEGERAVFVPFGQGYQSMSPALRALESAVLEGNLRHGGHPVLNMCLDSVAIAQDPAGNRKFVKRRANGRIDGMVALAMALGVAAEYGMAAPGRSYLETRPLLVL